ncbi:alpha/beta hydrolase [Brevibacterium antiquum]|uniref:alpha/beta fold hydrolase n=1 Tax=Brevibacterium antiquum TaxID=234835 RepID=UPI0018DF0554|nr:alpha/beta hydrolase [Brevibacterium antiquum]
MVEPIEGTAIRRPILIPTGLAIAGAVFVAGMATGAFLRRRPRIGHFTSGAAKGRYMDAYSRAMEEMPADPQTFDIRTEFGVVRVYKYRGADDNATPVLLLPGRAAASPMWAGDLPWLLAVRSVYVLDLLGEPGMSVQDRPMETSVDQATWLHEVLEQLPEPEVHVLGLSFGGWVACNLAIHFPKKISSVVLLEPVFTFAGISAEVMVRSIPATIRWLPKRWREQFTSWTAGGADVEDVPVARVIEAGLQTYSLKLPYPQRFTEEQLQSVDRPMLVVLGGRSGMHDSYVAAATARRVLRRGEVEVFADASHAVNGDATEELAARVTRFLQENPDPSAAR